MSVGDLLDRGLTAIPIETASTIAASGSDLAAVFRNASSMATPTAELADLGAALILVRDPRDVAEAMINGKYSALGGASGVLGSTAGSLSTAPDGTGWYRHFRFGSIYWHPAVGAHEVHGAIRAKWASLGWETGFLGYPTTDQLVGRDPAAIGAFNRFQGGAICWHPEVDTSIAGLATVSRIPEALSAGPFARAEASPPLVRMPSALGAIKDLSVSIASGAETTAEGSSGKEVVGRFAAGSAIDIGELVASLGDDMVLGSASGAHEVHGAIGAHYFALGGTASFLGYPVTDETGTPDGVGRFNHFQAGSIYWSPGTWAQEVHGLIRDAWASAGWERNAALGYPITDEEIPDRRIGHRHPEHRRKPIVGVPVDLIKMPAEAAAVGFSPLVSNVSPIMSTLSTSLEAKVDTTSSIRSRPVREVIKNRVEERPSYLDLDMVGISDVIRSLTPSEPGPVPSVNRFGDFENGVLFWRRGATTARALTPWTVASDGEPMSRSAQEVVDAIWATVGPALGRMSGVSIESHSFAGTTGYAWDGASVRNRRHRIAVTVRGASGGSSGGGIFGAINDISSAISFAIVQLEVEAMFSPLERIATICLADWRVSVSGDIDVMRQLHERLDPLLYVPVTLIEIPDTDSDSPIAVLSAKTMVDGAVRLYIEPDDPRFVDTGFAIGGIARTVRDVQ